MRYETIATTSEEEFIRRGAQHLAERIRAAIEERNRCVIGLSGGSTPRPVYNALSQMPGIDWSKVWVFLVDERIVPNDDPRSNQYLVRSSLLRHAPIPESQLVFPDTTLPADECVNQYATLLTDLRNTGIDLLVLGMGEDGHIASLFPPVSDLAKGPAPALHTLATLPDTRHRISVTLPVLTDAVETVFLLRGEDKRKAWEAMLHAQEDWHHWPAKAVLHTDRSTLVRWW